MHSNSDSSATTTVDAGAIDGKPFDAIMDALNELDGDETLLVVNRFEPEPLYAVLDRRGFEYETNQVGPDEWHVRIERA